MARLFELENDRLEQQNKVKGIITSVTFHALLILLFYFLIGVKRPFPPLSDQGGVMVNLGYMDEGTGTVQPMGVDNQVEVPQPVKANPPVKTSNDKIITQENSDVAISTKKNNKKDVKTQKTKPSLPVVEAPQNNTPPKPKSLYTGGTQNSSTGEGNDKTPGDKGQINGSPFGDSYTGGPGLNGGPGGLGSGDGYNWKLKGRNLLVKPDISDKSQETGVVVIKIKVDKNGKVISADGPAQGSTTTSNYLLGLAKKAALGCKFDAPAGVPDEQFGTITFNFKVK
jgi:outer membrane biosynthesis protein TonB